MRGPPGQVPQNRSQMTRPGLTASLGIASAEGTLLHPKALRTLNVRLLGPKPILYKAFGAILRRFQIDSLPLAPQLSMHRLWPTRLTEAMFV